MPRQGKPVRTNRTEEAARAAFLQALCGGISVTGACEKSGLPRRTVYDWRDADEKFAAAWDEAIEAGTETMEDEARRRAQDGVDKPVYQGGKRVGSVREFSDTLMMFLLKGRKPEKYRENVKVEMSGTVELAERVKRARERADR